MFTGIILAVGKIATIESSGGDVRLTLHTGKLPLNEVVLGDSIAVNGVCLTAVAIGKVKFVPFPHGPWWIYMGGTIGVIYIAFTSTIVQHLGVLTFTLFSTGGQLVGALLIDIYSPTEGVSVSAYLVSGIVMTFLGVLVGGVNSSKPLKR